MFQRVSMEKFKMLSILYSFLFAALVLNCHCQEKKVHIVYMGELPQNTDAALSILHHSMLKDVLGSHDAARESLLYSYGRSFNGFVAKLSDDQVARLKEHDRVVSVIPNTQLHLHTTRSWDFVGLKQSYLRDINGGDIVIGMIDSGIWPEAESFNDKGFGPPPAKWKGTCAKNFTCNKKIIGARYYHQANINYIGDVNTPRDVVGHGTHTASTAGGNILDGASFYDLASGVARGGLPGARIAVYKACAVRCFSADILAAFDDAIADGVDILSVSLGGAPDGYFEDVVAIGSFHAMKKGILTSQSAGNGGPYPRTVTNVSPWGLTVAASTIDRKFVSRLALGNGQIIIGNAINPFDLNGTQFPLIWGGDAVNVSAGSNAVISSGCVAGSLNSLKVQGKIVLCDQDLGDAQLGVLLAGGVGAIIPFGYENPPEVVAIPTTLVSAEDSARALNYIRSTRNPIATILVSEAWKDEFAPRVASFSSRGYNPVSPDILKPDLTAPGVDILAAWSPAVSPTETDYDTRSTSYNIISGTSMACPHATGAAAYVKAAHPTWSPAMIKSALMTTAHVIDPRKHDEAEFAYGSGHINPVKAVDPGLVFDADESDYIDFLCKHGYNTSTIRLVSGDSSTCKNSTTATVSDLNYPSFSLAIDDGKQIAGTFTRTVTNVGSKATTYYASYKVPKPLRIEVTPAVLHFNAVEQKKKFTVKVSGPKITQESIFSGSITWKSDDNHVVRTPLVVFTVVPSMSDNYFPGRTPSRFLGSHKNRIPGNS